MYNVKISTKDVLPFLYCIFITTYYSLRGWKFNNAIIGILLFLGVIFGCLQIFKYIENKVISSIILAFLILLSVYRMSLGSDTRLIISIMSIFVGMHVEFYKIVRWILYVKGPVVLFAIVFGGYTHINYVAMNMGTLVLLELYYNKDNIYKALGMASVLYILGSFLSKSGSFIICISLAIVLYVLSNIKVGEKIIHSRLWIGIFPISLLLNLVLVWIYSAYVYSYSDTYFIRNLFPSAINGNLKMFIMAFNQFVSGRINLAAFSLEKFGYSFWGGNLDYKVDTGLPYFLVDSGMILLLQDWGFLMMIISMVIFVFMMWRFWKNRQDILIITGIVVALWSMNEDVLISVGMNFLFFAIGANLDISKINDRMRRRKLEG